MTTTKLDILMGLGLLLSLVHCFYFSDYNLCLFGFGWYIWHWRKSSRRQLLFLFLFSIIYDILFLFFMAKSRSLVFEVDPKSQEWEEKYLQNFKITFGLEVVLKLFVIVGFVLSDTHLKSRLRWGLIYDDFVDFFTLR